SDPKAETLFQRIKVLQRGECQPDRDVSSIAAAAADGGVSHASSGGSIMGRVLEIEANLRKVHEYIDHRMKRQSPIILCFICASIVLSIAIFILTLLQWYSESLDKNVYTNPNNPYDHMALWIGGTIITV